MTTPFEVISYSRISFLWSHPRILITTMILRSCPSMHTYRSRINVLMYTLGYFKKRLSTSEKLHFLEILESYRRGRTPLCSAASILRSWVIRFKSKYLREQTFFNPFPGELMALDDSGASRT